MDDARHHERELKRLALTERQIRALDRGDDELVKLAKQDITFRKRSASGGLQPTTTPSVEFWKSSV